MEKKMSSHAAAAAAIRAELKRAFPAVKFQVRSESYSMGDSVRIHWQDGPTVEAVDAITKKYQYGHFDGMTDMYEHSNCRTDIPQTKFVQTERRTSDAARAAALAYIKAHWGNAENITSENDTIPGHNERVGTLIYRMLRRMDLTGGFDSTYPPKQ